jgi:hypothetical protein
MSVQGTQFSWPALSRSLAGPLAEIPCWGTLVSASTLIRPILLPSRFACADPWLRKTSRMRGPVLSNPLSCATSLIGGSVPLSLFPSIPPSRCHYLSLCLCSAHNPSFCLCVFLLHETNFYHRKYLHQIWYLKRFRITFEKAKVSSRYNKNNRYCVWIPIQVLNHISKGSAQNANTCRSIYMEIPNTKFTLNKQFSEGCTAFVIVVYVIICNNTVYPDWPLITIMYNNNIYPDRPLTTIRLIQISCWPRKGYNYCVCLIHCFAENQLW